MSVGWGHALAAAVGGFMKGRQMAQGWQDDETEKAFKQEQRDVWRQDQSDKKAERSMLQQAAQPVEMFSGDQQTLDSLGDKTVGPQENEPTPDFNAPMAFQVGTQRYADQTVAQKAADAQNAPEAQSARMAQGYRSLGMPEKATALEHSDRRAKLSNMQLADAEFRNQLGTAMASGPEAIADLITKNAGERLGGATIQAVPGADGQTVSFVSVDAEGKATPFMGMTNLPANQAAITAGYAIDKLVTPQQRLEFHTKLQESARQQSNADRSYGLAVDQFKQNVTNADRNYGIQVRSQDRQDRLGDVQIKTAEAAYEKAVREDRIPPAVKMQMDGVRKELDVIGTAVAKAQADGSWNPEADGAKQLIIRQAALTRQMRQTLTPYMPQISASSGGRTAPKAGGAGDVQSPGYAGGDRASANADSIAIMRRELEMPGISDADKQGILREIGRLEGQTPGAGKSKAAPAVSIAADQGAQRPGSKPAPKPAPKPEAKPVNTDPMEASGQKLDGARQELQHAKDALKRFGLKSQRDDAKGLAAAKARVEKAVAEQEKAEKDYESKLPATARQAAWKQ